MLSYVVVGPYIELTATGFVSANDAQATFRAIRNDPNVPEGLPYLMDLRQYDESSMPAEEMQPRVLKMFQILGPKIGKYWALVIDSQVEHVVKARLLQHIVQGDEATVMVFRDIDQGREWIEAMAARQALRVQENP